MSFMFASGACLASIVSLFVNAWTLDRVLDINALDAFGNEIIYSEVSSGYDKRRSLFVGHYSLVENKFVRSQELSGPSDLETIKDCTFALTNDKTSPHIACISDSYLFLHEYTNGRYSLKRRYSLDVSPKSSSVNWSSTLINAAIEGKPYEDMQGRIPQVSGIKGARRVYSGDINNDGHDELLISQSIGSVVDLKYHYLHVFKYIQGEVILQNSIIFAGSGEDGIGIFDFDGDGKNELLLPTAGILKFYKYSNALEDFYLVGWSESLERNVEAYSLCILKSSRGPRLVYGIVKISSGPLEPLGKIMSYDLIKVQFPDVIDPVQFNKMSFEEKLAVSSKQQIVLPDRQKHQLYPGFGKEIGMLGNIANIGELAPMDMNGDGIEELLVCQDEKAYFLIQEDK